MGAKKQQKRRVCRSDSFSLTVRDERRNSPNATKIAKVLIDIARNPDIRTNETEIDQTESAEGRFQAARPPEQTLSTPVAHSHETRTPKRD
ncbi:hypothetical protein SAMN05216266_11447 [Amycolatopsis marina]|uniref:Uncharacterized protein n=1 Tax=Amycolatopsis marina TaxID=490629 RepID=A0A1I1BLZ7_9PSEU|nr:hypothetical protein [Amycolatopsis marina]SFB49500.1 hypothetical protein SAMN05216266_11447 [Amycolatopsis marina]